MKFYGIDLHYDSFAVAMIDEDNQMSKRKIYLHSQEFRDFLNELSADDYVAVEASTNSFWFYDQVIGHVRECFIINPWKFLEIRKSHKKTDKIDGVPRRPPFLWVRDPPWQLPVQPRSEECMWWG